MLYLLKRGKFSRLRNAPARVPRGYRLRFRKLEVYRHAAHATSALNVNFLAWRLHFQPRPEEMTNLVTLGNAIQNSNLTQEEP